MGVDDDGVLGDGGSFVEKAVEEKGFGVDEAEDDVGAEFGGCLLYTSRCV